MWKQGSWWWSGLRWFQSFFNNLIYSVTVLQCVFSYLIWQITIRYNCETSRLVYAGSFRGPRTSWDAAARRMKWSIRNKIWWTRNSPEEASTWLAPPHEAATFSGSRLCNRNHFFLALDLRDNVDCSESPRVPSFRRLVFFVSPTSLFPSTPPSLHQSPNIPPFTSLVHVPAKDNFWYFSSFLR